MSAQRKCVFRRATHVRFIIMEMQSTHSVEIQHLGSDSVIPHKGSTKPSGDLGVIIIPDALRERRLPLMVR